MDLVPYQLPDLEVRYPEVRRVECEQAMHVVAEDGTVYRGAAAFPQIMARLPRWAPFRHIFKLRPVMWLAEKFYAYMAAHRQSGACKIGEGKPATVTEPW
jgi:hypothetical protein